MTKRKFKGPFTNMQAARKEMQELERYGFNTFPVERNGLIYVEYYSGFGLFGA